MRQFWLIIAILSVVILSACSSTTDISATSPTDTPTNYPTVPSQGETMPCTLYSVFPEPREPASINLPPISSKDWSRGPENALLTILVYSDFQCPYCSYAGRVLKEFEDTHPDEFRMVFRHFPLTMHDKAYLSAQAAEAAGLQGKFWEMHDFLVNEQNWNIWTTKSPAEFETWIIEQAATIGLDADRFSKDLTSAELVAQVKQSYDDALNIGLNSTPSLFFFIEGELIFTPSDQVPYDAATLSTILTLKQMEAIQYTQCPPAIIDEGKQYTATIKTEKGDITIKLFADKSPLAVNNFVFLARQGFYNGVTFHRVIEDFVAQSGDPTGTGGGGPGYQFADEISEELKFDRPGLVGMANSGTNTNGSQFFITYQPLPNLDGKYTIFGEVIAGMDVVNQLTLRDPSTATSADLPPGDKILSITIEEK